MYKSCIVISLITYLKENIDLEKLLHTNHLEQSLSWCLVYITIIWLNLYNLDL